jgi:hypothetical protein
MTKASLKEAQLEAWDSLELSPSSYRSLGKRFDFDPVT